TTSVFPVVTKRCGRGQGSGLGARPAVDGESRMVREPARAGNCDDRIVKTATAIIRPPSTYITPPWCRAVGLAPANKAASVWVETDCGVAVEVRGDAG